MNTNKNKSRKRITFNFNWALLAILAILVIVISLRNPNFLKFNYLMAAVVKNIMEIGMLALPMTLIIITGGIDLSVGSIMIFSAISGGLAAAAWGNAAGVVVALLIGVACGLLNGFVIVKLKISALVTTLATMFLFRGIAKGMTGGDSVYTYDFPTLMGTKNIGGAPLSLFFYVALAVLFTLMLSKTATGRSLFAIGLNANATRFSGIKVDRNLILIYALSGLVCAIASFFFLGRFTSVKFDVANSVNLKVVTVIVLGGTSILGGVGDMKGTIIATFIMAALNSGLSVMRIPIDVQTIIHGTVLVIALIVYSLLNAQAKKSRILEVTKEAEPKLAEQH
jgi:ribose transport system permease protein/rhamnose transport system permease protein